MAPPKKRKPTKTSWTKGVTGNAKGRPTVGNTVAEAARGILDSQRKGEPTRRDAIITKMAEIAETGSVQHATFLFDRAYGKPREVMEPLPEIPVDDEAADFIALVREDVQIRTKYLAYLKEKGK